MPRKRGWGEGEVVSLPNGRARVRWREGGQRRSRNFPSRQLAEVFLRGVLGDLARERAGQAPDPRRFPPLSTLADGWIERRKTTHRSWSDDRGRWNHHLAPHFGKLRPADVEVATIRAFVEAKLKAGANKDTIRLCIACGSSLFSDLAERPRETGVERNPFLGLPKTLKRLYRSDYDSRFTPYVERLDDVRRIFQAMPEPQRVAYAIGAVAGLRPGEILALGWDNIRQGEQIDVRGQVQDGRHGPTKDNEARILRGAFLEPLWSVLAAWRLKTDGKGLLFAPTLTKTPGRRIGAFMHPKRLKEGLATAAEKTGLDVMTWAKPWYQATRHTFATHWLRAGHSLAELATVLGHSNTWVTEHYAHVRLGARQDDPWTLDLLAEPAEVVDLGPRLPPASRQRKHRSA